MSGNNNYQQAASASTASFVTSLIVNSAVAGGEFVAFVVIRGWLKAVYEPRTYIPPLERQAPPLGKNPFLPLWKIIWSDPDEILTKTGVDPYVFVRFLRMMSIALIPIWLISWVVLLPADAANSEVLGKSGLDKFTFGNVAAQLQDRYWAHLILDYLFIGWIMYLIWVEMQHWLIIRQRHLINPAHSKLAQANTVLITGIPKGYLDEEKLEQLFSRLPGGVKRIWLNRNLKEMPDLYSRRDTASKKLEAAQVKLIKLAHKYSQEREEKIAKLEKKGRPVPSSLARPVGEDLLKRSESSNPEQGVVREITDLGMADRLVPRSMRPKFRLKHAKAPLGIGFLNFGEKVDTIDWARKEIAQCTEALEKSREQLARDIESPGTEGDNYPPLNSAFILFNQQIAAHMAQQVLTHHQAYRMNGHYIEQAPENVIWRNLSLNPYEQSIRRALSYAATGGLILAWAPPVAFLGALSNVTSLTEQYPWMSWLGGDDAGKKILQGVVSGLLSPVLLMLVIQLLPSVLRQLAIFEGMPNKTNVELDLMTRYFVFLVINTFFIVTLSSGLVAAIPGLANDPASIANILASQMPTASTFFITLILTQFTGTAGTLLQIISLALYYIKVILFGATPRSVFNSRYTLQNTSWGAQFPQITVYMVIMLAYMIISPIINGFGACFFLLNYAVYKYLFIWVQDQPPESDTGGLFFPKAVTQVFVGMYIQEVCLCALFFLARDENLNPSAIPQAVLMIVLIVITAAVHYTLLVSYAPLIHALPLSLAHLSYGMAAEKGHENSVIGEDGDSEQGPAVRKPLDAPTSTDGKDHTPAIATAPGKPVSPPSTGKSKNFFPPILPGPPPDIETDLNDLELGDLHSPASTHGTTDNGNGIPNGEGHGETDARKEFGIRYFAVPGGPGVQKRNLSSGDDPLAFVHPAAKDPQRILWLPKDELGLGDAEVEANERAGVKSTCRNAILNSKGTVEISGRPPDDI